MIKIYNTNYFGFLSILIADHLVCKSKNKNLQQIYYHSKDTRFVNYNFDDTI